MSLENVPVTIKVVENIKESIDAIEEEYRTLQEASDHPNFPEFYGCFLVKDGDLHHHQLWFVMEVSDLKLWSNRGE